MRASARPLSTTRDSRRSASSTVAIGPSRTRYMSTPWLRTPVTLTVPNRSIRLFTLIALSERLKAEQLRRTARHVDDAAPGIGPAIVDADLDAAAVVEIGHLDDRRQRQRAVGGGHRVEVEGLAVGGVLAVECLAVP